MKKIYNAENIGFYNILKLLIQDLARIPSWYLLSVFELLQKFKSTKLGIFWITLNTIIWIATLNFLFSYFAKNQPGYYLLYLSIGIIFWNFLNDMVEESTSIFVFSQHTLLNSNNSINILIFKLVLKHILIILCNSVIYLFLLFYLNLDIDVKVLSFLVSFLIFIIFSFSTVYIIAIISLRFRDFPNLIKNILKILFFITPIFWNASILGIKEFYIKFNPLFYLFNIIRKPLLGEDFSSQELLISSLFTLLLFIILIILLNFSYKKITKWI